MKFKFSWVLGFTSVLVAVCGAYFSVFGLSQLFAGSSKSVIIMASSLEFSKLVTITYLHRYWNRTNTGLKTYLTIASIILITITSAGIYGYLSNAYQITANKYEIHNGELTVIDKKISLFENSVIENNKTLENKRNRIEQLTNLRNNQETRLDSAKTNKAKDKARADISISNSEIQKLTTDIDDISFKNNSLSDSISKYSVKILEKELNSDVASEIGPLKYLSELTGYSMGEVVNWFILLLVFVFDPLAVMLVIATNKVIELDEKDENEKIKTVFIDKQNEEVKIEANTQKKDNEDENIEQIEYEHTEHAEDSEELTTEQEVYNEETVESVIETPKLEEKKEDIKVGLKLEDIKEIKERNRGFSVDVPERQIERIGNSKPIRNDYKRFGRKI